MQEQEIRITIKPSTFPDRISAPGMGDDPVEQLLADVYDSQEGDHESVDLNSGWGGKRYRCELRLKLEEYSKLLEAETSAVKAVGNGASDASKLSLEMEEAIKKRNVLVKTITETIAADLKISALESIEEAINTLPKNLEFLRPGLSATKEYLKMQYGNLDALKIAVKTRCDIRDIRDMYLTLNPRLLLIFIQISDPPHHPMFVKELCLVLVIRIQQLILDKSSEYTRIHGFYFEKFLQDLLMIGENFGSAKEIYSGIHWSYLRDLVNNISRIDIELWRKISEVDQAVCKEVVEKAAAKSATITTEQITSHRRLSVPEVVRNAQQGVSHRRLSAPGVLRNVEQVIPHQPLPAPEMLMGARQRTSHQRLPDAAPLCSHSFLVNGEPQRAFGDEEVRTLSST